MEKFFTFLKHHGFCFYQRQVMEASRLYHFQHFQPVIQRFDLSNQSFDVS